MLARKCVEKTIPIFEPALNYGNQAGNRDKVNFLDPKFVVDSQVGIWPQTKNGPGGKFDRCGVPQRRKRSSKKKLFEGQWVHSHETKPQFSATEVCKMPGLKGPHYANVHEGKFCNVDDRSLWDICNDEITTNCFDIIREELIVEDPAPIDPTTGLMMLAAMPKPRSALKLNRRLTVT